MPDRKLDNIVLPFRDPQSRWDVTIKDGIVDTIRPSSNKSSPSQPSSLLLPAFCHPHLHLDKPYILTCDHERWEGHVDYSDLAPQSGSFLEAHETTSAAKARYTEWDLATRGSQLLAESYRYGVTAVRAFVEVDHVTRNCTLMNAAALKSLFRFLIDVQICVFAQDPIFSTVHGEQNRSEITSALRGQFASSVDVLGTTPYVEENRAASLLNIEWAVRTAQEHSLHLDFHLDYNLDLPTSRTPLIYEVIDVLLRYSWPSHKTVVLGHCTQLTQLPDSDLAVLADKIKSSKLPLHFVGLPTSDLFMMGRPHSTHPEASPQSCSHSRPRGTLQVPSMIKDFGLSACLSVNNVGNAYTPFGTADPLQLACWGAGLYHAGTVSDAELLYGCVSWRARQAIGIDAPDECQDGGEAKPESFRSTSYHLQEGKEWRPALLIENKGSIELPGRGGLRHAFVVSDELIKIPARQHLSVKDVVWSPPDLARRKVVR